MPMISRLSGNRVLVAVVGSAVIAGMIAFAVGFRQLPLSKTTYHAAFATAAGLSPGDEVRIAGISVGEVSSVELNGAHVEVAFTVDNRDRLGRDTTLHIKILSILGQVYLDVQPTGPGELQSSDMVPVSRTSTPYTLLDVLGNLSTETQQIDLAQLSASLSVVSDSFRTTPAANAQLLAGLSRLSQTIGGRSQALSAMVNSAESVTSTLVTHQGQLVALLGDADLVLQTLEQRRQVIHQLLLDASALAQQVSSLITQDSAQLKPMLDNLKGITDVLARDQASLDSSIQQLGPFARVVANATGSGKWVDLITPTLLLPDNVLVQCQKPGATKAGSGCTP
jgi:phospholipid/cholesterol/gamma-HCH transport system substrate-binding protein